MTNNTRYTRRHMSLNIAGALRNYGQPGARNYRSMDGLLMDDDGKDMNDQQVRIYLHNAQLKGWKKIPCGDCEGFDHFGGGCPGHPITKEQYESNE